MTYHLPHLPPLSHSPQLGTHDLKWERYHTTVQFKTVKVIPLQLDETQCLYHTLQGPVFLSKFITNHSSPTHDSSPVLATFPCHKCTQFFIPHSGTLPFALVWSTPAQVTASCPPCTLILGPSLRNALSKVKPQEMCYLIQLTIIYSPLFLWGVISSKSFLPPEAL